VQDGTALLTDDERTAIARYLAALKSRRSRGPQPKSKPDDDDHFDDW
jgi:hypothetical protein